MTTPSPWLAWRPGRKACRWASPPAPLLWLPLTLPHVRQWPASSSSPSSQASPSVIFPRPCSRVSDLTDVYPPAKRSEVMRRVKGQGTSAELAVRRLVWSLGGRYRLNRADLPGKPDLVALRAGGSRIFCSRLLLARPRLPARRSHAENQSRLLAGEDRRQPDPRWGFPGRARGGRLESADRLGMRVEGPGGAGDARSVLARRRRYPFGAKGMIMVTRRRYST